MHIRSQIRSRADDGSLLANGAIALCLTVLTHRFLLVPLRDYSFVTKVLLCGWIAWAIGFLGLWSMAILLVKYVRIHRAWRLLDEDLLPEEIGRQVCRENAATFSCYLACRFGDLYEHPLVRRLDSALQRLAANQPLEQVTSELRDHARVDTEHASMGYTMVRAFVWAIPIFGFIGTVIGIGQAIGGFSASLQSAENINAIKAALGDVVRGLAFAFDTTLIGLLMALSLVIPMGMVQRCEHAFLAAMEAYCSVHLARRLVDTDGAITGVPLATAEDRSA